MYLGASYIRFSRLGFLGANIGRNLPSAPSGTGEGLIEMETDTNGDKNSELETRTLRSSDGPADQRRSTPPEVVLADMWGTGAPAPQAPAGEAGGGSRAPSSSGGCDEDHDGCSQPVATVEEGRGILYCCGRRLDWFEVEDSPVLEASCASCKTTYAMDTGSDYFEIDAEDPPESRPILLRFAS